MTEWTGNILFQKHVVLTNLDIYICINLLRDRPFNLEGGGGYLCDQNWWNIIKKK
jgi:hypothetical protein